MKLKRLISALLSFALLFANIAFADDKTSDELTKVILEVKSKVHIPDEYSEFEYNRNEDEFGKIQYSLVWRQKDEYFKAMSVTADANGEITLFYSYSDEETKLSESVVLSEEEAIKIAQDFINKVNKTTIDRFFYSKTNNMTGIYQIDFVEKINDIIVKNSYCSVSINKDNKKVISMHLYRSYSTDDFANPNDVIDLNKAKESYLKSIGFETSYMLYKDYEKRTIKAFPVYNIDKYGKYAIDALTGEKIKTYSYYSIYDRNMLNEKSAVAYGGGGLTESERIEVDNTLNLISSDKAIEIVNKYFALGNPFTVNSIGLNRNHYDKESYIWNINGTRTVKAKEEYKEYVNATVDAVNGTILSFNNYKDNDSDKKVSKEEALNSVLKILNENAKDIFTFYKIEDEEESEEEQDYYNFSFIRYENGIKVNGNSINAQVSKNGNINYYNITFDKNIKFEPLKLTQDNNKVFETFCKNADFGLYYNPVRSYNEKTKKDEIKIYLTYDFKETPNMLDTEKLIELDYKGEPRKSDEPPKYTDIENHWVKEIIDLLIYNNYYLVDENKFEPDKKITQSEFLKFIFKVDYLNFDSIDEMYKYAIRSKIILESEVNPDSEIDRKFAAKLLVRKLGFESLTKRPEIFNYPYYDTVIEEYKPYIAICYSLYLINGDENKNYNPDSILTRAECAAIIYNMLKVRN